MEKHRRSRKFIDSWAQLSIALEVVVHSLLFLTMIALILFAPPFVTMFSDYSATDHQAVAKELFLLNYSKWPLFLLLALFVGFASVLFSHHLVGPAYHFRRVLQRLNERDLSASVQLRKWDYFHDVQDALNQLVARLGQDFQTLQQDTQKAVALCEKLKEVPAADDLRKQLVALEEALNRYQPSK